MNRPEIVSVGVVWDSERPTLEHIMDVFSTVGTSLQLKDVFHSVVDQHWASITVHNLVGVVTYYGKHYSTFFFHTKLRLWIYFDDATVKEVGPRWDQVVDKCRRGRYQPLLLLYATPNGTPCNTESAPKTVVPFPNMNANNMPGNNTVLRRSVTPSPEKPIIGNTRRAITPNPDNHMFTQSRPPINRQYNEYQNLAVIQDNLFGKQSPSDVDAIDGDMGKEPDYISRKTVESVLNAQNAKKQQMQLHRSLSTGSTSANLVDNIVIPDHLNVPRRRDSGNWSGDRNSTSSSSSTTMENPYLYLVGKIQQRNGSVPGSPTRKGELSSGSSGRYDAGYDSYSLSSTDSLPLQQGLKHNLQLAQIPEYQPQARLFGKPQITQDDCERLCLEADQLLDKSRQTEDNNDLETALVLCNAAATKARAAMDAPYNNPHTMTFARMKHNTCIMRARSLHRRMLQEQGFNDNDKGIPDVRHTREGSNSSARHSRQNSRDKTSHSRQNSKEMLATPVPVVEKVIPTSKNIEIYATLPKKKSTLKKTPQQNNAIEDEEYMIYDRPNRESRSIFGRSKNKDEDKAKEKRSRSEDRSKISKDLSLAPDSLANAKDTLKREKNKEDKDEKKSEKEAKPGKKQHKIRRKLLMGGLIRRKNRSMPDLTEGNGDDGHKPVSDEKPAGSVDDSAVGLKGMDKNLSGMSGYLSEGHLEYSGNTTNPNLERSKLMRKSFHGSAGKMLTIAKVPPPPPLRTTSQLTGTKPGSEVNHEVAERPPYPLPNEVHGNYFHQQHYTNQEMNQQNQVDAYNTYDHEPQSLPFLPSYNDGTNGNKNYLQPQISKDMPQNYNHGMIYDSCIPMNPDPVNNYHMVVTKADVHQERSPIKQEINNPLPISQSHMQNLSTAFDNGIDEVDCIASRMQNMELPPYPSPPSSIVHSRQPSEDFPPPPPPLHTPGEEEKPVNSGNHDTIDLEAKPATGLLAQLQQKRQQILSQDTMKNNNSEESTRSTGETWLRELQAKQAALRLKKSGPADSLKTQNEISRLNSQYDMAIQQYQAGENSNLVKSLTSRFEFPKPQANYNDLNGSVVSNNGPQNADQLNAYLGDHYPNRRTSESSIGKNQIEEEIREVEMLNAAVNRQLSKNSSTDALNSIESKVDHILRTKKKSVSFCDQVILVATAEDQEDDSYIPNPILERVLKSALNKPETITLPLQGERPSLHRQDSMESQKSNISCMSQNSLLQKEMNLQNEYMKAQIPGAPYQQNSNTQVAKSENINIPRHSDPGHQVPSMPLQHHRMLNDSPYQHLSNVNNTLYNNPLLYQSSPTSQNMNGFNPNQRQPMKTLPQPTPPHLNQSNNQNTNIYNSQQTNGVSNSGIPSNNIQTAQNYPQNTQILQNYPQNTQPAQNYLQNTQPTQNYQQNNQSSQNYPQTTQPLQNYQQNTQQSQNYAQNTPPSQNYLQNSTQNYNTQSQQVQNTLQNTQSMQNYLQNAQTVQNYTQNTQYNTAQHTAVPRQVTSTNNYPQATNAQQQKQNSMYFPVNRTQPMPGNSPQYSQMPTSNNSSPYQHLPTSAHIMQNNDNGNTNQMYDTDYGMKYTNNTTQLKPEQFTQNTNNTPNYNYTNSLQQLSQTAYNSPYQRVPLIHGENINNHPANMASPLYQRLPQHYNETQPAANQNQSQKAPQQFNDQNKMNPQYISQDSRQPQYYQQGFPVENGNGVHNNLPYQSVPMKASPYQQLPLSKQPPKKSVSFEPGTKGGSDIQGLKASTTNGPLTNTQINNNQINSAQNNLNMNNNIMSSVNNGVNNSVIANSVIANSAPGKNPCNLCRKKQVNSPAMYCVDCDFYMSRFKPRTQ